MYACKKELLETKKEKNAQFETNNFKNDHE